MSVAFIPTINIKLLCQAFILVNRTFETTRAQILGRDNIKEVRFQIGEILKVEFYLIEKHDYKLWFFY